MTDYNDNKFNEDDEERMLEVIHRLAYALVAAAVGILLCALFSGCTTTQYIPVIEHHTDTLIQTKVQKDSIYVHDSTIVEKGDSIIKIEHWHTKYVDREVHDTTYVSKTDTIPAPYPVETIKEVEKPLAWWQKTLMWLGVALIGIIAVWIWRTK